MKSVLAVLFVVFLAAQARVPRDAPESTPNQPTQLSDLISEAQANINNLAKQIQEQLNLPDQETVVNVVKEQSSTFVTKIQDYMKNVTEEVKNKSPEFENLWTDVKGKLNKVVEDISAGIPNAKEQVTELQAKLQEGIQALVQESDKAVKAIKENSGKTQEEIGKLTKQAVDIAVQAAQNLNTQLQQAAASNTSS